MRIQPVLFLLLALVFAGCSTGGDGGSGGSGGDGDGGSGGSGGGGPTTAEICQLWVEGHVENEAVPWTAGADACDPGALSEVAVEDTLRRINLYRVLAGLPPVTEDPGQRTQAQACAVLMNANLDLSHEPPPNWSCWSEDGAAGARSSNLALGAETPGDAIDLLMSDVGVDSMGHRRWLLGYFLGRVGIGFAGVATCVGVFDDTGRTDRPWTAFPPAGPAPIDMVIDRWLGFAAWSFHPADGIAGAEVSMQRLPGEEPVTIDSWIPETGFGIPDAIVWQPPPVQAGESYRITITRPAKEPVIYDVDLVDCR